MSATKVRKQKEMIGGFTEELEEFGENVRHHVTSEVGKGFAQDTFKQLLSSSLGLGESSHHETPTHADQSPAEKGHHGPDAVDIFLASNHAADENARKRLGKGRERIDPGIDYHGEMLRSSERGLRKEKAETNQMVQEMKGELESLAKAVSKLGSEFSNISTEQAPQDGGEYHKHFFEWMLAVIRNARRKVEEASSWMSTIHGKNAKKGDFSVANGKMHQSGERTTVQNAAG